MGKIVTVASFTVVVVSLGTGLFFPFRFQCKERLNYLQACIYSVPHTVLMLSGSFWAQSSSLKLSIARKS